MHSNRTVLAAAALAACGPYQYASDGSVGLAVGENVSVAPIVDEAADRVNGHVLHIDSPQDGGEPFEVQIDGTLPGLLVGSNRPLTFYDPGWERVDWLDDDDTISYFYAYPTPDVDLGFRTMEEGEHSIMVLTDSDMSRSVDVAGWVARGLSSLGRALAKEFVIHEYEETYCPEGTEGWDDGMTWTQKYVIAPVLDVFGTLSVIRCRAFGS